MNSELDVAQRPSSRRIHRHVASIVASRSSSRSSVVVSPVTCTATLHDRSVWCVESVDTSPQVSAPNGPSRMALSAVITHPRAGAREAVIASFCSYLSAAGSIVPSILPVGTADLNV